MTQFYIYRKFALTTAFVLACILLFAQNTNIDPKRKYHHTGGFEHIVKSKLVLKKNGKFKVRNRSAQFGTVVKKGDWKVSGDTLILTQSVHFKRVGFRKKAIRDTTYSTEKYKITREGLNRFDVNGNPADSAYYKP